MKELQQILTTFDDWLWGNWLLFVLLGVGLLYTIITGGIQIHITFFTGIAETLISSVPLRI